MYRSGGNCMFDLCYYEMACPLERYIVNIFVSVSHNTQVITITSHNNMKDAHEQLFPFRRNNKLSHNNAHVVTKR